MPFRVQDVDSQDRKEAAAGPREEVVAHEGSRSLGPHQDCRCGPRPPSRDCSFWLEFSARCKGLIDVGRICSKFCRVSVPEPLSSQVRSRPMSGRRGRSVSRGFSLVAVGLLLSGCASLPPMSSLVSPLQPGSPPLQVNDETRVDLAGDNFALVKTNVLGRSKGFALLGFITIYPAALSKAMNRMYAAAQMHPGRPETVAHLVVERSSSYWILFGIPKVEVRADIVEFRPQATASQSASAHAGAAKPLTPSRFR